MPHQIVRCPRDPVFIAGIERIRRQLDVPTGFAPEVLHAAADAAAAGPSGGNRSDRRDIELVAIDPPGSADIDQAFAAERRGSGYRIFYAIADVEAFVEPGGPIDLEARRRGVTLYSPDTRTPLYPSVISEDAASLVAGEDRPARLWIIDIDEGGRIEGTRLERAIVRSRRQLTYREAQDEIDRGEPLRILAEIGEARLALEAERDAVHLALPSQEVVETGDGTFAVVYEQSLPVEDWNAQISLLTGIAASRMMLDAGVGLLRTLPAPEAHTVDTLRRSAWALGIEWPDTVGYASRIRSLRPDTPQAAALLSQAAAGLRGAGYLAFAGTTPSHDEARHSAINSTYAHVTAPLRRLCDRFANAILVALAAGEEPPQWATEALEDLPSIMNRSRGRAGTLDRAVVDYVEAMMLAPRVGERFSAVITDVDGQRKRARAQLRDPAVVAWVPSAGVALGSEVDLVLESVDAPERTVRFSVRA